MKDEVVQRVLRLDLGQGELGKARATPQGGLIVHARISRTGVLRYRNADGTERRELRLPEDVFKQASVDSFATAPVTSLHPGGLVTPLNWREHVIGHGGPRGFAKDGDDFLAGDLHVQDAAGVRDVEAGNAKEVSCGYQCRLDRTPGVHPKYGAYDAIQRDIVGNHIALGPSGWGRSGADVSLHMDGGDGDDGVGSYVPAMAASKTATTGTETTEPPTTATPPATNNDAAELRGRNAALESEVTRLTRELSTRDDAATTEANRKRFDAAVATTIALVAVAAPILGAEWKHDGKTDDEIRRDVLAELEPDMELPDPKADGADREVMGAFRYVVARADRVAVANRNAVRASPGAGRGVGGMQRPPTRTATRRADDAGGEGDAPMTIGERSDAAVAEQKDRWKTKKTDDRKGRK